MNDNQLVVGCVVLLSLFFTVSQCEGKFTMSDLNYSVPCLLLHNFCPLDGPCRYKYLQQPAMPVEDCNSEIPVPLELICQVYSNINSDNFTIRWHYSNSYSPPSEGNSTSMETVIVGSNNNMIEIKMQDNNTNSQVSMLRLTNYGNSTETASGYYWCTVQSAHETFSNPSQVVNIDICPFTGSKADWQSVMDDCPMQVNLSENLTTNRCAEGTPTVYIEKVQLGSTELCAIKDLNQDIEESTTTDEALTNLDQSTIMTSPASGFPMYYVWMIVGITFGILIAVIIIMLIAIVYLNHKKNKIRGKVFKINRPCMTL